MAKDGTDRGVTLYVSPRLIDAYT